MESYPTKLKLILKYSNVAKLIREMKVGTNKKQKLNNPQPPIPLIPTLAHFQVMGNGSRGSPKCVHLFTNSNRYLFNVGEGTQRLVIEHKCKLSKLSGIFITHSSWENVGGLPGVTLCLKDIGINKILLHGPPKVENLFIMTKCFMQTEQMDIEKYDYTKRYDDGCLIMEYIAINKEKINLPLNKSSPLHSSNLINDSVSSDEGDSSGSEGYFLKSQESVSKNIEINLNGTKSKKQDGRDINIAYIGEVISYISNYEYNLIKFTKSAEGHKLYMPLN